MIFDKKILDDLSAQAKSNSRLHQSLDLRNLPDDKSQLMLNAIEPGNLIPIARHSYSNETLILLRGKLRVLIYNNKEIIEDVILDKELDNIGYYIPKMVWHKVESLEVDTILFGQEKDRMKPLKQKIF